MMLINVSIETGDTPRLVLELCFAYKKDTSISLITTAAAEGAYRGVLFSKVMIKLLFRVSRQVVLCVRFSNSQSFHCLVHSKIRDRP
jgi:hypothetical protein